MLPIQSSNIQNPALLTMDVSTTAHLVRALSSQGPHHRPTLYSVPSHRQGLHHRPTLYSVPSHRQGLHHRPTLYSVLPSQLTLMMFIFFFFLAASGLSCTTQDLSLWHMGLAAPRHVES